MGHLQRQGFTVRVESLANLRPIKAKHGVPVELEACHTALVDGYVVEGHVPADLIVRLLRKRPNVLGLAVPGMPAGSPGMMGDQTEPLTIFEITKDGTERVFATE